MSWSAVIALASLCVLTDAVNYCSIPSCGTSHTMCKYRNPGPSSNCVNYQNWKLSDRDKVNILFYHNWYRSRVARGQQGPQPSAADMMELVWDNELAAIAQRWADQCTGAHDECRDTQNYYVGQNVAWQWHTASKLNLKDIYWEMVYAWYKEVVDFPASQVYRYTGKAKGKIGHYTQMVWGTTRRVGCGMSAHHKNGWTEVKLVCNYGPGGNYLGRPLYRTGRPCSGCPAGTSCSRSYSGLCN